MEEAFAWLLPEQARGRKGRSVVNRLYHGGDAAASARPGAEWSGGGGDQGRIRAQSPTRQNSDGCFHPVTPQRLVEASRIRDNPLMLRHTRKLEAARALNGRCVASIFFKSRIGRVLSLLYWSWRESSALKLEGSRHPPLRGERKA